MRRNLAAPYFSYRGVVATEHLPDWPAHCWSMWLGPGKHFLTYPPRVGALINFVAFVPADEPMKESWSAAGDPMRFGGNSQAGILTLSISCGK
jgi:hypothetical protein